MNASQKRDLQLNLRLSEEDRAKLDALSKAHNMNNANVLRMLIAKASVPPERKELSADERDIALRYIADALRRSDRLFAKSQDDEVSEVCMMVDQLARALFTVLGEASGMHICEECTCLAKPGALCPQCHRSVGR